MPKIPRKEQISVLLPHGYRDILDKVAAENGKRPTEYVREAVVRKLDRDKRRLKVRDD